MIDSLVKAPANFDFFQAVRLLERMSKGERVPVGGDRPPEEEAVSFRVWPGLGFPAGSIVKAEEGTESTSPELWVTFLGLIGAQGVLPQHYSSLLLSRIRKKDFHLRDFLDMFHHRIMSLFYRAWEKNRLPFSYEHSRDTAAEDAGTRALFSLIGLGTGGTRGRCGFPDESQLYFGGLLARSTRSAVGLQQLLSEYFGVEARVVQYEGQWLRLDRENQANLPDTRNPLGSNTCLGRDVIIGRRVWDVQSKIRLSLGPLRYATFHAMLPGGDQKLALRRWVRQYLGLELDVDVQLLLAPEEVPWTRLRYDEEHGPRLGWNSWARSHNVASPPTEAVFALDGTAKI
ncbi:MAG: type VI secretion system baseplate subunit TssG [Planctomycetes bacterium]|nr:type VI secretion system baseplate subunit TssG [Planctomycetota bacterium]